MRTGARAETSDSAAARTPRGGDSSAGRRDDDSRESALFPPSARALPFDVDVWEPTS
jgi:hypothetical protein